MKIDFPAGLMLVQASQKSVYRPGQFGALLSIEWAEGAYWFTINWPDKPEPVRDRVKFHDLGDLAIIPVTGAMALLNHKPIRKDASPEILRAEFDDLFSTWKIFRGYADDLEDRLHEIMNIAVPRK